MSQIKNQSIWKKRMICLAIVLTTLLLALPALPGGTVHAAQRLIVTQQLTNRYPSGWAAKLESGGSIYDEYNFTTPESEKLVQHTVDLKFDSVEATWANVSITMDNGSGGKPSAEVVHIGGGHLWVGNATGYGDAAEGAIFDIKPDTFYHVNIIADVPNHKYSCEVTGDGHRAYCENVELPEGNALYRFRDTNNTQGVTMTIQNLIVNYVAYETISNYYRAISLDSAYKARLGKDVTVTPEISCENESAEADSVTYYLDGAAQGHTVEEAPFSYTFTGLEAGMHTLTASAHFTDGLTAETEVTSSILIYELGDNKVTFRTLAEYDFPTPSGSSNNMEGYYGQSLVPQDTNAVAPNELCYLFQYQTDFSFGGGEAEAPTNAWSVSIQGKDSKTLTILTGTSSSDQNLFFLGDKNDGEHQAQWQDNEPYHMDFLYDLADATYSVTVTKKDGGEVLLSAENQPSGIEGFKRLRMQIDGRTDGKKTNMHLANWEPSYRSPGVMLTDFSADGISGTENVPVDAQEYKLVFNADMNTADPNFAQNLRVVQVSDQAEIPFTGSADGARGYILNFEGELAKAEEYRVCLLDTLTAANGETHAPKNYYKSFFTEGEDYTFAYLAVMKDGVGISSLSADTKSLTVVPIVRSLVSKEDATMIVCVYDKENRLVAYGAEQVALKANELTDDLEFELSWDEDVTGGRVCAYLWDSLNGMKALCGSRTFES